MADPARRRGPAAGRLAGAVLLLLLLWGTRVASLEALPLHNDEGLHLQRAIQVWNGHPFWAIADGKIVNHWPIALFYPQHTPVFAGRFPTVLIAMIGLAAGWALAHRLYGPRGALLAAVFWVATPYLFFYERMAFSDAEAGALIVVAVYAAILTAETGGLRRAVLTGLALAAAVLFKFTAAPYALTVLLIVLLWGGLPVQRRLIALAVIGAVGAACFAVPLLYIALKEGDFSIALGWIGGGSGGLFGGLPGNLARLAAQTIGPRALTPMLLVVIGWLGLLIGRLPAGGSRRDAALLLLSGLLPPGIILLLSADIEPRHFVVALPLALTLAGMGWGGLLEHILRSHTRARRALNAVTALLVIGLLMPFVGFFRQATTAPGELLLPPRMAEQNQTEHSAGFGLREAVRDFPSTIGPPGPPVIASMFPDGCKRAAFYDTVGYRMICPAHPGLIEVEAALTAGSGPVYVLEEARLGGFTPEVLEADAAIIARYPRPGETMETASVRLWRLDPR